MTDFKSKFISFDSKDFESRVTFEYESTASLLITKLVEKMAVMMDRLKTKLQTGLQPDALLYSLHQRLHDSVKNPRADIEGGKVVGKVDWGETATSDSGFNYAHAFEEGTAGPYVINPLYQEGTSGLFDVKGHWRGAERGKRLHAKGAELRRGSNKLKLFADYFPSRNAMVGKFGPARFADYTFHPGIQGRHYFRNTTADFQKTIRDELLLTMREVMARKGRSKDNYT